MDTWMWRAPTGLADSETLWKAVTVMRATADLLKIPDGCESIELSDYLCEMVTDLLRSIAEETLMISLPSFGIRNGRSGAHYHLAPN